MTKRVTNPHPNQAFSLTPIEAILASAMNKAGIEFEAQSGLGKYTADFIVRIGDVRFLVEASKDRRQSQSDRYH